MTIGYFSGEGDVSAPCSLGGCYSCLVEADNEFVRACVTPVRDGMRINTREETPLLQIVHGPEPHTVGGKATPWWTKGRGYIEVAIWAADCNLRCPQCLPGFERVFVRIDGKSTLVRAASEWSA